jgi:Fur family transcriptional regulator, zinc uptake regulator
MTLSLDSHGACRHTHAQHAGAPDAISRAEKRCARAGARLTPIRKQVLAALLSQHRPMGAYDLAAQVKTDNGRKLAPISIYRALDFLMEQGLAHRLNSINAYSACLHDHVPGAVIAFMICDTCGGVDEGTDAGIIDALQESSRKVGFTTQKTMIELTGRCDHCG